jgi:hemoglobin-like flavoprotein
MSDLKSNDQGYEDWSQRVVDLLEGNGSEVSRRLTKEMIKTFPSLISSLSDDHQKQVKQLLQPR